MDAEGLLDAPLKIGAQRANYGKQILVTVSQELTAEFGAGFSSSALTRMAGIAEWMTDDQILASPSQELSWSGFSAMPNPSASGGSSRAGRTSNTSGRTTSKPHWRPLRRDDEVLVHDGFSLPTRNWRKLVATPWTNPYRRTEPTSKLQIG